jgi:hypothetical protein
MLRRRKQSGPLDEGLWLQEGLGQRRGKFSLHMYVISVPMAMSGGSDEHGVTLYILRSNYLWLSAPKLGDLYLYLYSVRLYAVMNMQNNFYEICISACYQKLYRLFCFKLDRIILTITSHEGVTR